MPHVFKEEAYMPLLPGELNALVIFPVVFLATVCTYAIAMRKTALPGYSWERKFIRRPLVASFFTYSFFFLIENVAFHFPPSAIAHSIAYRYLWPLVGVVCALIFACLRVRLKAHRSAPANSGL